VIRAAEILNYRYHDGAVSIPIRDICINRSLPEKNPLESNRNR
jgi:hypothetical protein